MKQSIWYASALVLLVVVALANAQQIPTPPAAPPQNSTAPSVPPPQNTTAPTGGVCDEIVYGNTQDVRTCGAFGDPHIRLFNGTGVNCGYETDSVLIDNDFFEIRATAEFVSGSSGNTSASVTAYTSITFTYKYMCNPWSYTFNESSYLNATAINQPGAGRHAIRVERNNVFIDALHLRFQVRMVAGTLVFGLSIPQTLVELSTGICPHSCPGNEISMSNPPIAAPTDVTIGTRAVKTAKMAAGVCEDAGLTPGSFEFQACEFDVGLTGNPGIAQATSTFVTVDNEVSTTWEAPGTTPEASTPSSDEPPTTSPSGMPSSTPSETPSSTPSGTPSSTPSGTPSAPSSNSEPSDASRFVPSLFALLVLVAVFFL